MLTFKEFAIWEDIVYLNAMFESQREYEWDVKETDGIKYHNYTKGDKIEWELSGGKKRRKFIPNVDLDWDWNNLNDKLKQSVLKFIEKYLNEEDLLKVLKVIVSRIKLINKRWLNIALPLILLIFAYSYDYNKAVKQLDNKEKKAIEASIGVDIDDKGKLESEYKLPQQIKDNLAKKLKDHLHKQDSLKHNNMIQFVKWRNAIRFKESSSKWWNENGHYIGYYQFGQVALTDLHRHGFKFSYFKNNDIKQTEDNINTWRKKFIEISDDKGLSLDEKKEKLAKLFPEEEQNHAFEKYCKINKHYIRKYLKYLNKEIGGVKLTLSGMLAGAHLVGNGGLKTFINSNGSIVPTDNNNPPTPITEYIKNYGKYNFDL